MPEQRLSEGAEGALAEIERRVLADYSEWQAEATRGELGAQDA